MEDNLIINPTFKQPAVGPKVLNIDFKVLAPMTDNFAFPLKRMPYINYPVQFKKDQAKIQALIDFGNEINTIISIYAFKLGFKV